MKPRFTSTSKLANYLTAAVLVLVPFHAFLTVWVSQFTGHYTALRLWNALVLLVLCGVACYWLAKDVTLRKWLFASLLFRLIIAYAGLTILLGVVSYLKGDVTPKALGYGLLVNLRFLAWFLVVLLTAQRNSWLKIHWPKLILIPAAIVVIFASLQYTVLPHNFLSHFGYNAATTIAPIETINHNNGYIRVQATLRGANPLGAYLVLIISILGALYVTGKRKAVCVIFGVVSLFALYASGSRSAWIGAALSLGIITWLQLKTQRAILIFSGVVLGAAVLLGAAFVIFNNNTGLQNAVLHTQDNSAIQTSSNEAHGSAVVNGLKDTVRQPLGAGPGTAGPASVYNGEHPSRIAENYYVQIVQEVGWLGLALFLSILVLVATELYNLASTSRLALALFAGIIGISFINLLSHAWVDDTLAFLWWGLAGIALGHPLPISKGQKVKSRKTP